MEFFDSWRKPVEHHGESIEQCVRGYALIERDMGPEYHELLMVRSKSSSFLELPGGGQEETDPSVAAAIDRECREEIGAGVSVAARPFCLFQEWFFDRTTREYFRSTNVFYEASLLGDLLVTVPNAEIEKIEYVEVSMILERMEEIHPAVRAAIKELHRERYGPKLKFEQVGPGVQVVKTFQRPRRCGIRR